MKDAAKLLAYFAAVVLGGAILAPLLYWGGQGLAARGMATFLRQFDFESFFHRALLLCAILFLWPLLRATRIRSIGDLELHRNSRAMPDAVAGWLLATIPLVCAAVILFAIGVLSLKNVVNWSPLLSVAGAALAVPLVEELFFRGLVLGIFLRAATPVLAAIMSSLFFAALHFLKSPAQANETVFWYSGFRSITRSVSGFGDPILVSAAFVVLFAIGWILADARLRTRSLWLGIGLHSGWIFASGLIAKITRRETLLWPWLGPNLLTGIIPLALAIFTWLAMIAWLRYDGRKNG